MAHRQCVHEALAALGRSEQAQGSSAAEDLDAKAWTDAAPARQGWIVFVALISGRSCACDCSKDRTIGDLKLEAQQELGVMIKSLIGPNMEPLNEGKTLEEENVRPGNTLTVVAVDQAAEDEKEARACFNIIHASELGKLGAVRNFLRMDPGLVHRADGAGLTALHWAAQEGHVQVCRVLLEAAADVEVKERKSRTPLHSAAFNGNADVVKLLLEAKASLTKDGFGPGALAFGGRATPLDDARENGHNEVVKILEDEQLPVPWFCIRSRA
eukprot:s165_g31.t1